MRRKSYAKSVVAVAMAATRCVERNCLWVKIHGGHSRHVHQSERGGQLGG